MDRPRVRCLGAKNKYFQVKFMMITIADLFGIVQQLASWKPIQAGCQTKNVDIFQSVLPWNRFLEIFLKASVYPNNVSSCGPQSMSSVSSENISKRQRPWVWQCFHTQRHKELCVAEPLGPWFQIVGIVCASHTQSRGQLDTCAPTLWPWIPFMFAKSYLIMSSRSRLCASGF